jgi:cell division protein FtsW
MVYSASSVHAYVNYDDAMFFAKRQLVWAVLGVVAVVLMLRFDYWRLRRWAKPILWLALAALVLVLLPGVGQARGGSQRWINLGFASFQPSEMIKLALVVYFSYALAKSRDQLTQFFDGLGPHLVLLGFVFGLIMLQPDFGTALTIAATAVVLIFTAGARLLHLVMVGLAALPVMYWLVADEPYRMRRILAFLDPQADPLGYGYHIIQSLYALGSGGLFGVGLGQSLQKFFYVPAQHTDFIFAILGEELGFLGVFTLLVLFLLFAWRGYRIALTAPDTFGSLLAVGITTMITAQALINIGVVTATLPITGITLPFVSYGGSSLLFTLVGVGMLMNISKHCRV